MNCQSSNSRILRIGKETGRVVAGKK